MTEEQFKVPVLKNVIYALRLVWQTDKRLLIGYLLQEGLYAVFSRYLQNILFLKILLDVITGSGDFRTYVGELAAFALLALVVKVAASIRRTITAKILEVRISLAYSRRYTVRCT